MVAILPSLYVGPLLNNAGKKWPICLLTRSIDLLFFYYTITQCFWSHLNVSELILQLLPFTLEMSSMDSFLRTVMLNTLIVLAQFFTNECKGCRVQPCLADLKNVVHVFHIFEM